MNPIETNACTNCGAPDARNYCSGCGQQQPRPRDYSLSGLAAAIVDELSNYDGRVWGSLHAVFFQPGQLARDHFDGKRLSHLSPLRLFLISNLAAWLIIPYLNITGFNLAYANRVVMFPALWERALAMRAYVAGVPIAAFKERIIALGSAEDAAAVLCMVPLSALGLTVALAGRNLRFVQHLVFSAHLYCVHLLSALLMVGAVIGTAVLTLRGHPEWAISVPSRKLLTNMWFSHALSVPFLCWYLWVGLQRAYGLSRREAGWRAVLLAVWQCTVSRAFFDIGYLLVLVFA